MQISQELFSLLTKLNYFLQLEFEAVDLLIKSAEQIGKSWSNSWLGYHSTVYYNNFAPPPPGARFSQANGLTADRLVSNTRGEWIEYPFDYVKQVVCEAAGNPDLSLVIPKQKEANEVFEEIKDSTLSLIYTNYDLEQDNFLKKLVNDIENSMILSQQNIIDYLKPSGQFMCRDMVAIEKGLQVPPHLQVWVQATQIKLTFQSCDELYKLIRKLANHIKNMEKKVVVEERIGTNIFIGHGRSHLWRELKDFIDDRVNYQTLTLRVERWLPNSQGIAPS